MSRRFLFLVVLAAAFSIGCTAQAGESKRPALRVVDTAPLTVAGSGFRSGETVRVSYRAKVKLLVKRVSASSTGAFTVGFASVTLHPCNGGGAAVTARTASGVVVSAKVPQPLCPPDATP